MGRHSLEEVKQRLEVDLDACADLLAASGAFLTGASPCQADCFLFALIDAVRSMPTATYTRSQATTPRSLCRHKNVKHAACVYQI